MPLALQTVRPRAACAVAPRASSTSSSAEPRLPLRRSSSSLKMLSAVRIGSCSARRAAVVRAQSAEVAATTATTAEGIKLEDKIVFSGLNGKALNLPPLDQLPSKSEVLAAIPEECFKKDTAKSLGYAFIGVAMTAMCAIFAYNFIPLTVAAIPAWIAYALVTGTIATGPWVIAHECGHGAFSDNRTLQDAVGYVLHSALLVPYFSWQRSHAVHHARTNHLSEGETHVPEIYGEGGLQKGLCWIREKFGTTVFAVAHAAMVLTVGWPMYLLRGASGGPVRGKTNHFWPWAGEQARHSLFPGSWKQKVLKSDIGVFAVIAGLAYWAFAVGSIWPVVAMYVGPYLVTNAWLVGYTWLQHTDTDIPHYDSEEWNWVRGAFLTVDRPYGPVFDFLHHKIGSTHVAHHVCHQIPHYNADKATEALKKAFPQLYLYDPTPCHVALWRIARDCIAVRKWSDGKNVYSPYMQPQAA